MRSANSVTTDAGVYEGPVLEAQGLTKSFGGLAAVKDASITLQPAKITALIGPNGAGKTTMFNLLTRFEQLDSGEIRLFGQDIGSTPSYKLADRGLVRSFQTPVGFPSLSVLENLMVAGMGPSSEGLLGALIGRVRWGSEVAEIRSRAEELLREVGLEGLQHELVEDIPGGEMKIVDFCRLLMRSPRLMLLDEPAAGVDPASIGKLAGQLRSLRADGISVLIVEHNVAFVMQISDYIYVMDKGRVVFEGVPEDVAQSEVVRKIYLGVEDASA